MPEQEEEEVITPKWLNKNVIVTLCAVGGFVSTIIGMAYAADERWATNESVTAQFASVTVDIETNRTQAAAAVTEVKTDLQLKIKTDEKDTAENRLYALQDRLATARSSETKNVLRGQIREQEGRLRDINKSLDNLTQRKAEAIVVRSGAPPVSFIPMAAPAAP